MRHFIDLRFLDFAFSFPGGIAEALQLFPWLAEARVLPLLEGASKGILSAETLSAALVALSDNERFDSKAWKEIRDSQFLKLAAQTLTEAAATAFEWLKNYVERWSERREILRKT